MLGLRVYAPQQEESTYKEMKSLHAPQKTQCSQKQQQQKTQTG